MTPTTLPPVPKGSAPSFRPARAQPSRVLRRALFIVLGLLFLLAAAAVIAVLAGFAGKLFPTLFPTSRPDLITHKVKSEYLSVTVVERGTLESSENKDVICRVKAGSRGTFASSIKWVIEDGTEVTKSQLLMELDDSALQDQFRSQSIVVEKGKAEWVKATEDFTIQIKQNESDIATAVALLKVSELDVDKFIGVRYDQVLDATGAIAGAISTLVERGEYRQKLDDVSGRLKLAESDLEAFRERSSWADRAVRLGYLTASQAQVEQSKLAGGQNNVDKIQKEKYVLETFQRSRDLTDLLSKLEVARLGLERSIKQASAKESQAESTRRTSYSVYQQELDKLREIEEQLRECKLYAPQDGMVVYYKDPSSRFSSSSQGLIQVGEQVKEGQKLIRIPDLRRMQVNTRVHEALVGRIRGDDRRSTGYTDSLRAGMLVNPDPLTRLFLQSEESLTALREGNRDKEHYLASEGQRASIRVDAYPDRIFQGHVRSIAAVASQQDFFSSDVKVYQTYVTIDEVVDKIRPDMSAEVVIQVDPAKEPVLTVPIQAIVGGTEGGAKRRLFVLTQAGPEEREITLGLFNERMAEVKDGVSVDDLVVLNPKILLGDKAKTRDEADPNAGRRGAPGGAGGDKGKAGGDKGKGGKGAPGGKGPPAGSPTSPKS